MDSELITHERKTQLLNTVEDLSQRLDSRKGTDLLLILSLTIDFSARSNAMEFQEEPTNRSVYVSAIVSNDLTLTD